MWWVRLAFILIVVVAAHHLPVPLDFRVAFLLMVITIGAL